MILPKVRSQRSGIIHRTILWHVVRLIINIGGSFNTSSHPWWPGPCFSSFTHTKPPPLFLGHKNAKGKISEIINPRKNNPSAKFWGYLGDSQVKLLFHLFYHMWVCGNYELSSAVCCKNMCAVPHFATLLFGTMDFWHTHDNNGFPETLWSKVTLMICQWFLSR